MTQNDKYAIEEHQRRKHYSSSMTQMDITLKSRMLGCPTKLTVLLPNAPLEDICAPKDFYLSGEKLKVLWLLHGATGGPDDWIQNTNVARYMSSRKAMIVLPSALNSDYSNYTVFSNGFNYWDFFLKELMPFVYGWFPASSKREDNYIAGYSMGGTGAMMFGFVHPELFGGIGILSSAVRDIDCLRPYRDMTSAEFRVEGTDTERFPGTYPPGFKFKEINMIAKYPTVGDFLDSPENTWDRYIEAVKSGNLPKIYVSVGRDDQCYGRVQKFQKLASELGADNITFEIIDGYDHEFAFWDLAIYNTLNFFEI